MSEAEWRMNTFSCLLIPMIKFVSITHYYYYDADSCAKKAIRISEFYKYFVPIIIIRKDYNVFIDF